MHLQQLIGVWKLISVNVTAGSPGSNYGPSPIGRLIVTSDGYLNAMITDPEQINLPNGTTWDNATDAEVAQIARLMVVYEGPFTVQTKGNDTSLHTNIEISLTPSLVGTEQVRDAILEDKDGKSILTLMPVVVSEPIRELSCPF
jgi:Lipocalin-like domain